LTKRHQIVRAARKWISTPYVHQASKKGTGCDCLGLVRGVWREIEGDEPESIPPYTPNWGERFAREQLAEACRRHLVEIPPVAPPRPGDVLLFRWRPNLPAKHCAIMSGPGKIIHAYQNHAVQEDHIPPAWLLRIAQVFSFPGVDG